MYKTTSAQINFTVQINNIGCEHSYLGSAKIIVDQINPPYSYLWTNGQITSHIENLEEGDYKVRVTDGSGKDTTAVIRIRVLDCEMAPENIFTPNEDGYNDTWSIGNYEYFPRALVLVYNRWGQKVYESDGLYHIPWNGKDMFGVEAPDATYFYIVYKDQKQKKEFIKGSVSIVR